MISKDQCTGCSACKYSCPVNAIEMKIDDLTGFNFAHIDTTKCINCGKCDSVCPNKDSGKISSIVKRYVLRMNKSIQSNSSSGGAFSLLASFFTRLKYKIVGVKWDHEFNAEYTIANTIEEWREFRGSKYIQANIKDLFGKIKDMLNNGEKILFIGTPCHVEGLLNFLDKKYKYLYTIDFVCNSLPSPLVWQKWLKEEGFDPKDIKSINMRYKSDMGALNPTLRIEKTNNDLFDFNLRSTNFYRLTISSHIYVCPACYDCKFVKLKKHVSDFTIGDLYETRIKDVEYFDENKSAISFVSTNNSKAENIFEKCIKLYEKTTVFCNEINYGGNKNNIVSDKQSKDKLIRRQSRWFNRLKTKKLSEMFSPSKNTTYPYDVAIAGGTMCNNFGGSLTYFALYKYIESMGLKPVIIPPSPDSLGIVMKDDLFKKYCNISKNHHINGFSYHFNTLSNVFMIGSDQMWNRKLFKEWKFTPYLDFIFDDKYKIAYGVSYGKYTPTIDSTANNVKRLIERFDFISHREMSGCEKTKKFYGIENTQYVIDPVFFHNELFYNNLIKDSDIITPDNYICLYDLGITETGLEFIENIINGENCDMIYITTGNYHKLRNKKLRFPSVNPISVQDWLKYISNSKFVITNSYHGVCMSIILKKHFLYLGIADDRVKELLVMCNLQDRILDEYSGDDIYKACKILYNYINWNDVYNRLSDHIIQSKKWLNDSIKKCLSNV